MISGHAYKSGDVIDSMKGLTIEVANTDAEGESLLPMQSTMPQMTLEQKKLLTLQHLLAQLQLPLEKFTQVQLQITKTFTMKSLKLVS